MVGCGRCRISRVMNLVNCVRPKKLPSKCARSVCVQDSGMSRYEVVFTRHGESEWNKRNIFCGWYDADLSQEGKDQAVDAGCKLSDFHFDVIFTSLLKRAYYSVDIILKTMGKTNIEVRRAWKLNERHYGALTGFNKAEMAEKYGKEQVQIWRRSYTCLPPPMDKNHKLYESIVHNPVFIENGLCESDIPSSESLETLIDRVVPFWEDFIVPVIKEGKKVLVIAHGTTLRGLVKHLEDMSVENIMDLNIPTGIPFIYGFDENMNPTTPRRFFCDDEELEKEMAKVAAIGDKEK